jgi:hypothetical protein
VEWEGYAQKGECLELTSIVVFYKVWLDVSCDRGCVWKRIERGQKNGSAASVQGVIVLAVFDNT